jgi:hypothetical protein
VKALRLLAVSAAFSVAAISPSWAQFKSLGSVHVDARSPSAVVFSDALPGRLEWLGFRAQHGDVTCDSIEARFADGARYEVWRGGRVSHGGVTAELPANATPIRSLTFSCRGTPSLVEIEVMGEPGKYEEDWRRHPTWATKWWHRIAPATMEPERVAANIK